MKIAIIGGGFTGLTAAYELVKTGHNVTLFEKEKTLGGLAIGFRAPGWEWSLEKGYHHLFTNDRDIIDLLGELKLGDALIIKRPITANYTANGVYQMDSPGNLLSYPELSLASRLRTAALLAGIKLNPFWQPFEFVTAETLFENIGGKETWKHLWEPLVVGKFGDYAGTVAASWLWARIKKRTTELAYIAGGFQTLVDALEKEIRIKGGTILTGVPIDRIVLKNLSFGIGHGVFDKVLLTVPTPVIAKLVPDLTDSLSEALTIPHLHAQTLILETKEPILKDVYWLNILDRTFPFLAVVAHTNFMDKKHYGGHHVTYFGNYLPTGQMYLSMTKDQLLKEFLPYIRKLNPLLNSKFLILNSFLFVGPYAQPVHQLHYSRRAPKLDPPAGGRIPNLYIANLDSIYPWDRGTNYAVELGKRAADQIIGAKKTHYSSSM